MMIAYKLFRVRKDGSLGSLFINCKARLPMNEWLDCSLHPKKGYAIREGWHTLAKPCAPHLSAQPNRKWYRVSISGTQAFYRPPSQGGLWYLARRMKILGPVEERCCQWP